MGKLRKNIESKYIKLKKNIQMLLWDTSLSRRLLVVCVSTTVIIIVCFVCCFFKITAFYNQEINKLMSSVEKIVIKNIEEQMQDYEQLSNNIFNQSIIQDTLAKMKDSGRIYRSDRELLVQQMAMEMQQYNHVEYVLLQPLWEDINICTNRNLYLTVEMEELIESSLNESNEKWVCLFEGTEDAKLLFVRYIKRISNLGKDILARMVISIDVNELLAENNIDHVMCFMLNDDGKPLSSNKCFTTEQLNQIYLKLGDDKYDIMNVDGERFFFTCNQDENREWIYLYCFNFSEMDKVLSLILLQLVSIGLFCLMVVILFNRLISKDLIQSFNNLIIKFKDFSKDLSVKDSEDHNYSQRMDEVGVLYRCFDIMKEEIHTLVHEIYVTQLEKKSIQVEMLETQISPHFLYNTLQTISWQARLLHNKQISEMIEALSKILHLTLSNKKSLITLEEELEICQQYIIIQTKRKRENLNYEVNADFNLMNIKIPKLCIQPLLENAITYSAETHLQEYNISVDVECQDEMLQIYVRNNGSRFPDDLMRKLREKTIVSKGNGIGILNIDTRIKLIYGDDYGIKVFQEKERAVALLTIPLKAKE